MSRKKKEVWVIVLVILVLCIMFSGCTGNDTEENDNRKAQNLENDNDVNGLNGDPRDINGTSNGNNTKIIDIDFGFDTMGEWNFFNLTWDMVEIYTSGGGETGCCFLEHHVLVISRNGGLGATGSKTLEFRLFYTNGTNISFNHTANTNEGEEQYYGSYAITSGARFGDPKSRLIISNGFYCDGNVSDPISTYGNTSNWKYDKRYHHGNVYGWSYFPLIGFDMNLTNEFDEQDIVTENNVTFSAAYGNEPTGHTLSIGRYDGACQTINIECLGVTWPSIAGGTDGNPIVITWKKDDGGVGMFIVNSGQTLPKTST
ncbi:hypothetical protein [[Eubacterium] cellulosolvens]